MNNAQDPCAKWQTPKHWTLAASAIQTFTKIYLLKNWKTTKISTRNSTCENMPQQITRKTSQLRVRIKINL